MVPSLMWLEDPTVFQVNRVKAHSDHTVFESQAALAAGRSGLVQCLDGQWQFCFSSCPAQRPADFWQTDFDSSAFTAITVPGHLETQGFGQLQYINKLYDWDGHADLRPPKIDWDYNPVGSYIRQFDLEPGLQGKPVTVRFDGAEQAIYVWLNGHFVGYGEDSFTPSEFDLTPYLRNSGNRLCVELYKRSSAAWLEDQDFFSFSGLFRSVFLTARMPVAVTDVWFQTGLDRDISTGRLTMRLETAGETFQGAALRLTHPKDGVLFDGTLIFTEKDGYLYSQELVFPQVHPWDYGTPELYHAELTVENGGVIPYDIGFRRFEIENKVLTLNGKRLMLNGVNRHEWNPHSGRCITQSDMDRAMQTFHENNINAVRTCHYPDRSEWYFLCDREGIYMMDETNLETHGSWQKGMTVNPEWNIPGSKPEWRACALDRANSMLQRDKNHVSILFWSCGNESYAGTVIADISALLHAEDPSRVVHYEGVYWCREFDYLSDVESRMYALPGEILEYLENNPQKPYLNCEYMHNMGNSMGGLESYVRLGETFPMYQGGFIWDYMDQALWHKNARGETVLGYGGDFLERQSDYNFSANGIVGADGTPKPCMQEVRYWYSTAEKRAAWDAENARQEALAPMPPVPQGTKALTVTEGDGAIGVRGADFEVLFSKDCGGPSSIVSKGTEWVWRALRPAYWRAPTENDIGCGFPQKSAVWSAVDSWQSCLGWTVTERSEGAFAITYTYGAACMPDLKTEIAYRLERSGVMTVTCRYFGREGRPELPLFGLRFATPLPVLETRWVGLSGETYPDRFQGAAFGVHTEVPHIPNYLVPQECGNHFRTHSVTLSRQGGTLTLAKTEKPFSFSAIPYTPAQLADALHADELPAPVRTVITVSGEMRGVGGIDTWMTDVEEPHHVHADQDHSFSFAMYL